MKKLNREKVIRMVGGEINNRIGISSSGGSGGGGLAGAATQAWVDANYVSIEFFDRLFQAYSGTGSSATRVNANDTESTIDNIKAMFGFWTEQYLSALGQGSGGGGGGGAETLSDLLDVELTTLQNGQALIYSSALGKWTNGTAGVNMTQVWSALDSATNEQINVSHLTNALSGYVTTSAISDMATKSWVNLQGFATQTWVNQNFITIAFFDRLFQAYEGTGSSATRVNPNDTTSTIDNIKAMVGFWTELYLSALGDGSASSGSISLGMLSDVSLSSPTDGQALVFDATLGIWKNGTITSGVSSLSALTDVALSSPTTYQVLMYDASTTKWYNSALKTINGQPLYGSGDISVGGGASGNYLPLSGGTLTGLLEVKYASADAIKLYRTISGGGTYVAYYSNNQTSNFWRAGSGSGFLNGIEFNWQYNNDVKALLYPNGDFEFYGNIEYAYPLSLSNNKEFKISANNIDIVRFVDIATIISVYDTTNGFIALRTGGATDTSHTKELVLAANGNVGIGLSAPTHKLETNGTGYFSSTLTTNKIVNLGDASSNAIITRGLNGATSTGTLENLYINNGHSGSVYLCYGGGNVGIGNNNASYKLHVEGSIYATGGVTALSDARMKDVKGNLALMVDEIANAPAVEFTWKGERVKDGLQAGTLAQYWQKVLPMVVMDKGGELSMQYGVAALVSSIITARKVVDHEKRIAELERENKELKIKLKIA